MSANKFDQDQFMKSIMEDGGLEKPGSRFTDDIINTIKAGSQQGQFVYKPVISRSAWLVLAFFGILTFAYLMMVGGTPTESTGVLGTKLNLDFSFFKNMFSKISFSFHLSPIFKTSLIALFLFTFSNLIVFELKNRSFWREWMRTFGK